MTRTGRRTTVVAGVGETLGTALARAFAGAGDAVVLLARSPEHVESLADDIEASGGTALPLTADVTDPPAVRETFETVRSRFGQPDVLVHNAAPATPGGDEPDPETFERLWRVRAYGGYLCARAFLGEAADPTGGDGESCEEGRTILFPGTSYADEPSGRTVGWDSAAFATRGLARSLASGPGPAGVHVAYLAVAAGIAPPGGYVTEERVAAEDVAERLLALADADADGWTYERFPR